MAKGHEDIRERIRSSPNRNENAWSCTRCPKEVETDDDFFPYTSDWMKLSIGDMTTMYLCDECSEAFYEWFFAVNTRITEEKE
jgi:hypothetical protein